MNTEIELKPGKWLLVVGRPRIIPILHTLIVREGDNGRVRVVDVGDVYNELIVEYAFRRNPQRMKRIQVSKVHDCHQMLKVLERLHARLKPCIVLNLLGAFSDEFVHIDERIRLLELCLGQMDRLAKTSCVLVSVHPPMVLSQTEEDLLRMVSNAARETVDMKIISSGTAALNLS